MDLMQPRRDGLWRRYAGLLSLALVVGAIVSALVTPASEATPLPACATTSLRLDYVPPTEAATGHRLANFILRNVTPVTCRLKGYPSVRLLNGEARVIAITVAHQSGFPQPTVVLRPWHAAWFTFAWEVGAFCPGHSVNVYGISVAAPASSSRTVYYSGRFSLCTPPAGRPSVYPIRAARSLT